MQDPNQEHPKTRNSAGYRPLVPVDFSKSNGSSAVASLAAAAGIGLLVGVGIALTAHHSRPGVPPSVSEAPGTPASGASPIPPVYAATTSSLLNTVDTQKKPIGTTSQLSPAGEHSPTKATAVQKKSSTHKLWNWKKGLDNRKAARRKPYVSPNLPAADAPTAMELATAAAAQGPFYVGIEGDVTVASYDVAMGTIGTYEGSIFTLDKTGSQSDTIPWDDYPFNVHYRCDGSGSCTLVRHGATAIAKRTH
jgi:hypothetical protein